MEKNKEKSDTAAKVPLEHLETNSNKGKYAFYEVLLLRIAAITKHRGSPYLLLCSVCLVSSFAVVLKDYRRWTIYVFPVGGLYLGAHILYGYNIYTSVRQKWHNAGINDSNLAHLPHLASYFQPLTPVHFVERQASKALVRSSASFISPTGIYFRNFEWRELRRCDGVSTKRIKKMKKKKLNT